MPELPEVETVKNGLRRLTKNETILSVELKRQNIRNAIPKKLISDTKNNKIESIERRAKYLLIHTSKYVIINHLGMTGSWRKLDGDLTKHDHVLLHLKNKTLVYNDPRRFGIFDYCKIEDLKNNKWLSHLGPEPLTKSFNADYLYGRCKERKIKIKSLIMDQKVVVGVGNIYASEALFLAGISPNKSCNKLSRKNSEDLVEAIKVILKKAIKSGGSSIKDFKQTDQKMGYFQQQLKVYGRKGEKCYTCGDKIKSKVIQGRSTFWCPSCQK